MENIYLYIIRFFDKIKNKPKNITTRQGVKKTIIASNGRYESIEINEFSILKEGCIKKNVINTYMKSGNLPLLWRKFFLNTLIKRDHIINYCIRPFNNFDRLRRECYLSRISDDNEIRVLNDNLNNNYMLL